MTGSLQTKGKCCYAVLNFYNTQGKRIPNVSRTYPESNIGSVLSGKFSVLALEKGVEEKVK